MEWLNLLRHEPPTKQRTQRLKNLPIWDMVRGIPILGGNLDMYSQLSMNQTICYGAEEESQ